MATPGLENSFKNLKKFDKKTQAAVLELYRATEDSLTELIFDDSLGLRQAQNKLMKEFDNALASTDFVATWRTGVVNTIVASTYIEATLGMSKRTYANKLYRTSLFKDNVTLSNRIRKNANIIVSEQKRILRQSLKAGRAITETVREISKLDTLSIAGRGTGGFKTELPKFLEDIRKAKISGQVISEKTIIKLQRQVFNLKTKDLQKRYDELIDVFQSHVLDTDLLDRAVANAMVSRTSYFSNRLARTETINTLSEVKNEAAMTNPNTQWVRSVTSSGPNNCPYCLAVEDLGWVPVENATIPVHHPHCSCSPQYKQSSRTPEKWSNDKYTSKLQKNIDKQNAIAKADGDPKTYIPTEVPTNLRNNTLTDQLNNT
jgi:hypothetical protein